jgi:mRNA-degrading endonuclease RelE of RelBE toxin-antitoxin system
MLTFVETKLFSRLVGDYLSDDEYALLQEALIENPDSGPVVPGSGGVRKLRWGQSGRGKRGGVRIIYYAKLHDGVIWMLTIYSKNEAATIPAHVLRKIKEGIDGKG